MIETQLSQFSVFSKAVTGIETRLFRGVGWLVGWTISMWGGSTCGVFFSIFHLYAGISEHLHTCFSFKLMRHHFKRWPEETNTGLNQPETTQFDCYDLLSSNTLTYVRGGPDPWQLPVDEALDGYERQLQVPKLL